MECFCCGRVRDFDRIAIERRGGETLGVFCEQCEADLLRRTPKQTVVTMASCVVCGSSTDLLFPKWDTMVEDGESTPRFEFTVSLDTPGYCWGCAVQRGDNAIDRVADRAATD